MVVVENHTAAHCPEVGGSVVSYHIKKTAI
jgi:hypothetical protein